MLRYSNDVAICVRGATLSIAALMPLTKTPHASEKAMNDQDKQDANPGHNKTVTIIINGREREFSGSEISFEQAVELANLGPGGETIVFTVTYKRGHGNKPEGTLVSGETVKVKEGMIFNVTRTDKS